MARSPSTRLAGECPAGKRLESHSTRNECAEGRRRQAHRLDRPGNEEGQAGWLPVATSAYFTVAPGGEVPWHSHADRPALIYILQGTITEFTSTCADPIVHKAGDLAVENHEVSHWWKNTGKETAP
ncbi:MAG: cupin domain-containing protein [Dongiaceae bacterium]